MRTLIIITAILFLPVLGNTATLHVPSQFPTIQDAIDAALDGDTVLVNPGTYFENIDFFGKAITVRSSGGPAATVIDGSYPPGGYWASVVQFRNQEGPDSVLEGFTLANGKGTFHTIWGVVGGGILCERASPTIIHNHIIGNSSNYGGGIECMDHSSPIISYNLIADNFVHLQSGGGIDCFIASSPTITNNLIIYNDAILQGGGIAVWDTCGPLILNNTLYGNTGGSGGGIWSLGNPKIINTILWNNSPTQFSGSSMQFAHCAIQGGWAGSDNIDADPLFADPSNGDFHLTWLSPCINRGTNSQDPGADIDGDPRPHMGTVDMGADEFTGVHPLAADLFSISAAAGGKVQFTFNGGAPNVGRSYILLASVTGTAPGSPLPGGQATLRLNWDVFTSIALSLLNTPFFQNFMGNLDSGGTAAATFDTIRPIPGTQGITLSFAGALGQPWDFVSNPINVSIVP